MVVLKLYNTPVKLVADTNNTQDRTIITAAKEDI